MPPVSEFFEREIGDDSDEDEDIVVGGVTQDYRCPLSLTIMVDPITSCVFLRMRRYYGADRKRIGEYVDIPFLLKLSNSIWATIGRLGRNVLRQAVTSLYLSMTAKQTRSSPRKPKKLRAENACARKKKGTQQRRSISSDVTRTVRSIYDFNRYSMA